MMHSVLMVAALLAAASKGLETTTYSVNFLTPQAFAQGSESFKETTVRNLEERGVTIVSTSFEGTKYLFTVEEEVAGSTGSAMCNIMKMLYSDMKEICFVDGVNMGETALCTVSSFDDYAAQCTSDVSSTYYLGSPLASSIQIETIDALILDFYSDTLVRYVSSGINDTHYTVSVTETYKGEFAEMFCLGASTFKSPGEMCVVDSLSDDEKEYCKPSEGAACQPHDSIYGVSYPFVAASQFDQDTLDAYAKTVIAKMAQSGLSATFVSSFNYPQRGVYTIFVNETTPESFGNALAQAISEDANFKCMISGVADYEKIYYTIPNECFVDVEYKIKFLPAAASQINPDQITAQIQGLCSMVSDNNFYVTSGDHSYDAESATYTFTVNEQVSGLFGNVVAEAIKGEPILKCVVDEISNGNNVYYTTSAECFVDVVYNIKFLSAAASQINPDDITAQIQGMCQMANASGLKIVFVNNSYDASSAIYTFTVKEVLSGLFGNVTANAIKGDATLKCVVESMYSGEVVYFAYAEEECLVDVVYNIQFLSAVAPKINPDNITAQIQALCQMASAQGFKTEFVSKSYDVSTANYTFTVKETFPGAFGNVTAKAIKGTEFKCLVKKISGNNDVEYLTFNGDECYFTTVYKFGLSMNTPDTINKAFIDNLLDNFVDGETLVYVDSNFTSSLYTVTVKELQEGSVSDNVCSMLPGFVSMMGELCYVTFVKYGDNEAECTPRVDDYCAKINPGVTTLYEVKYYGNMSTKEELDAFFEAACKYARDASGENVKLVSSTYSKKNYQPTIVEPVTGIFGSHFCRYISDDYKCDFGSLKSGGNNYCNNPECKSAAFGFAPLAFLMALIFAFFF